MKVCPECNATNYHNANNCLYCGSSLVDVPDKETQISVVTGSGFASILSVALVLWGLLMLIADIYLWIKLEGYNFWFFLIGLIFIFLYLVIAGAILELFDNVSLMKGYMSQNTYFLKKMVEEKESEK